MTLKTDTFNDRLRQLIGTDSVNAFRLKCGIGDSTFRKYLKGTTPGLDKVISIAEAANVNIEWLATGKGPMRGEDHTDKVNHLEDPIITDLKLWLRDLTSQDPDYVAWFRVELQNKFPEFKEWRQKKRDDTISENSATG